MFLQCTTFKHNYITDSMLIHDAWYIYVSYNARNYKASLMNIRAFWDILLCPLEEATDILSDHCAFYSKPKNPQKFFPFRLIQSYHPSKYG